MGYNEYEVRNFVTRLREAYIALEEAKKLTKFYFKETPNEKEMCYFEEDGDIWLNSGRIKSDRIEEFVNFLLKCTGLGRDRETPVKADKPVESTKAFSVETDKPIDPDRPRRIQMQMWCW